MDFDLTDHVLRLIASFRRHIDSAGPVVVVQNGPRRNNRRLRASGARVVGFGANVGHGLALDWGLRAVRTQYVLICDPDSLIVSDRFEREIKRRLRHHGVAGVVISDHWEHQRYHPICTAFDVHLWKKHTWSMEADWTVPYDVGGELTRHLGGLEAEAVLPKTQEAVLGRGAVWAEGFSNIYGVSRIRDLPDEAVVDGFPVGDMRAYHRSWIAWADAVAAGRAGLAAFPTHPDEPPRLR